MNSTSHYIDNNKWIPLRSSKKSINTKLSLPSSEFTKSKQNKYKLHELIKNNKVVQDKAILPTIFNNEYDNITNIISNNIKNNNVNLVYKLIEQKKKLQTIHRSLNSNNLDKLTDTYDRSIGVFENYSNISTVINPLNSIISNWNFNPDNLYESTYTYLWDNLFSKGLDLSEYGCTSDSPGGPRKVKFNTKDTDKDEEVGFQKDYKKKCSSFLNSLNNIITSRVINLHQPSLSPIYNNDPKNENKSLTKFIVKNLLFGQSKSGKLTDYLTFFENIKIYSDIIFPNSLPGSFVTIKLDKKKIKGNSNKRKYMLKPINTTKGYIYNSLIKYDQKEYKLMNENKFVEYIIRPFGSDNKDLYKKYPLNIVENPSESEYTINEILEDITILYSIYCDDESVDWFLTNRKLSDTGSDTTTLNRKIARELLYLSLHNMIYYIKICFGKIKDELKISLEKKSINENLYNSICITIDNIVNIMFYNIADLFGFWKLDSFKNKKNKDSLWQGCIPGDNNIISAKKDKIFRLDSDAFDLPLSNDMKKFKNNFLFDFIGEEKNIQLKSENIEYINQCANNYKTCILVKKGDSFGSYEDFYINSDVICTKKENKLMYINTNNYDNLSKQFTKFLVGTSNLKLNKNKHSLGLFDSTNIKKNKLILDVFKQFARNNRLQVNKLIKYIDYFLRNYLTKMPIAYIKNLKEKFQGELDIINQKKKTSKRAYINDLINQYSNQYEGLTRELAETLIEYIKSRYKIKMENAEPTDYENFEKNEYKLIILRNKILFESRILRIIYELKVDNKNNKDKNKIKQTKKHDIPSRIINDLIVRFHKIKKKIENELKNEKDVIDLSLKISEKYYLPSVFLKLLSDATDINQYVYKRDLNINMLKPHNTAAEMREHAEATLARETETGCRITNDRVLPIKKIKLEYIKLRNRYSDDPDNYLANANEVWDLKIFNMIDPFDQQNHKTIYLPVVDYNFGGFGRILLDLKKWLKVSSSSNTAQYKNLKECFINVKKMEKIKGLILVNGSAKQIKNINKWRVISSRQLIMINKKTRSNMNRRYKFIIDLLTNPDTYKKYIKHVWPNSSELKRLLISKCFKTKNGKIGNIKCEKLVSFNCLATKLIDLFASF